VRKTQRLAAIGAMAALVLTMSACGGSEPATNAPATDGTTSGAAPAPGGVGEDGVTTPADVFGPACKQLPQGNSAGSLDSMNQLPVAAAAGTNPILKELTVAVKSAGLVDTLNSQKAITVFAPYDSAFDEARKAMGQAKYDALQQNKETLASVLKYHVVPRRFDKASLLGEQAGVATLQGGTLKITADGDNITVTDGAGVVAHVLCGNIPTKNATVFVIDKVLMGQKS
jgi:uncharacterized surface protein with fasciclin (FAS1) repeats